VHEFQIILQVYFPTEMIATALISLWALLMLWPTCFPF